MPNKELLQKWVDWLEDPKNEQAQKCLRRRVLHSDGMKLHHCCLGGLALVMGATFNEDLLSTQPLSTFYIEGENDRSEYFSVLPEELWDQLDISGDQGIFWNLNDNRGWNFQQIAKYIRKNFLEPNSLEHINRDG